MGLFGDDSTQADKYNEYQQSDNKAELSHEAISGAAAYEAMKAYENHCEKNGRPQSHAKAKEILAGFAGAFIDREFETRGMDFADKEKAKYNARKQAEDAVDEKGF